MYRLQLLFLLALITFSLQANTNGDERPERTRLNQYMLDTEAYLLASIEGLTKSEWNYKENSERWSIAEIVTHIYLAEQRTWNKALHESIQDGTLSSDEEIEAANSLDIQKVVDNVNNRVALQAQSPEFLVPLTVEFDSPEAFRKAFIKHRKNWSKFLREETAPLHKMVRNIPFGLGQGNLYHFQIFTFAHTSRHTQQIEEVRESMGQKISHARFTGACKVNTPIEVRGEIEKIFGEVLKANILPGEGPTRDRVEISESGAVTFVYYDDSNRYHTAEEHMKGVWLQFDVPWYKYESVKSQLKAHGVTRVEALKAKEPEYFYFHAPGGMVCRLARGKMTDAETLSLNAMDGGTRSIGEK